jgi:uncharacterized protein YjbI with pentapeptide repeats
MRKIFPMISASVSGKILKPVLIVSGAVVVFVSLLLVQQNNINSLDQKIGKLSARIVQASSIDERLKLEKDILGFEKDKTIIQNGAYTNLVQALGGFILSMTAWVGYKNFRVGEDKQVTERFSKSIEHLGSDKIDVRLGGIYALEQIAIDSAKYHWTIVEILSAFVREKCPIDNVAPPDGNLEQTSLAEQSEQKTSVPTYQKVGVDIQAAMTVLGRRKVAQDPSGKRIDSRNVSLPLIEIQGANLRGANLRGANLRGADLDRANLDGANLDGANLDGAKLFGANLKEANLIEANLIEANLFGAKLSQSNLREANLIGANLSHANLIGANLNQADLSHANLIGANLNQADLIEANLSRTILYRADLRRTNLRRTNLSEADLSGADLSGADLSGANLSGADLSEVNLINIKVQDTRFGDNLGISDEMKKELEGKGAIFEDSPGS